MREMIVISDSTELTAIRSDARTGRPNVDKTAGSE
jgi:hypothetical protein